MKKEKLLPMNLQFFAEGDDSGNDDSTDNGNDNQNGSENENGSGEGEEKKFTQSQVSAMMAKEKNEGKRSVLKSLGFSSEEDAKDAMKLLKALQDSQKDDKTKLDEANAKAAKDLQEAEQRAALAESKLICLSNGVDKDCLDDVMAIASSRMDKDTSLEDVIKSLKKDSKYASFFVSQGKDTGRTPGNNNAGEKDIAGDYGKNLASKNNASKSSSEQKTSYFD